MPATVPTRQRLIEYSTKRFYQGGFRNVGLDQILDEVGISKTAFYKHFESKDALMLAVLEGQNQWLQATFRQMVRDRGGRAALFRGTAPQRQHHRQQQPHQLTPRADLPAPLS